MLSQLPYTCFLTVQNIEQEQKSLLKPSSKLYFIKNGITYIRLKNRDRIIVPPSLQQQLISRAHESLGHPGISSMARVISTQYYFKGIIGQIKNYILKCKICQSVKKPTTPSYGLMGNLPLAEKPFDVVALDSILGLGDYNSTKNCLHVIVDHHSRYIWACPSKSTSKATYINIINQLLNVGKPKIIVTDRHPSFVSKRFNKFIQEKGIKHVMTSPSHPQCNGLVERANATIISQLRLHHQQNPRIPWPKLLQKALEEYRSIPHSITKMPPVYLPFGITPSYINNLTRAYPPIEEARRIANENTEKLHLKLVKRYNESHKTPNLKIGDKVLYKIPYQSGQGKLMPAFYPEPYTIISIPSPQTIEIDKPCQPEDPVTEDNTEPPFPFQEEEDLEGCLGVEPNKQASTDSPQTPRYFPKLICSAVITSFGLYEYNVLNFGLKNALSSFQRFIHEVLWGLDFVFPYLDAILIASAGEVEHSRHLKIIFERLNRYGVKMNISKSIFGVTELNFLGYLVTPEGSKPLPDKVKAIVDYKLPETVLDLRTFLGMINFYRRYLKDAAQTQATLHEYLRGARKKVKRKIHWTKEAQIQFEKCKQSLIDATLLSFPHPELPLSLSADASDSAIGGVIQQKENEMWSPVAFFSKKLNNTQKNYSTYDRELLSIYLSIKHFKYLLEGREFVIFTDHKPLIYAFVQKSEKATPSVGICSIQFINLFYYSICFN
ncbi:hypothetical protein LAZ67_8003244 [Cordylochernes scorpioides]|uniref:RNA-directed DNA polymerase n=1 Tax=Cordylochernes scorpioides TaxID=51811 RepID=A0ABY6KWH1_9ARAC|nr:hypothetical protein LAZ67_8003244 [Cordylochernes scorpioides]